MSQFTNRLRMTATVFALALAPTIAIAQQTAVDVTKRREEQQTKIALAPTPAPRDMRKSRIETPIKDVLRSRAEPEPVNPKVAPGKVKWHADFAAACEAAKKSGKPVLLFHLMGQLDLQFC
jgi:hypothetical protein